MSFETYINIIETSVDNAENEISNNGTYFENTTGKTSKRFLNNILSMSDARYLEVGNYYNTSICSTMYNNNSIVVYIEVDTSDEDYSSNDNNISKEQLITNFNTYKGNNDATFIDALTDINNVNISELPNINIFVYSIDDSKDFIYDAFSYFYEKLDNIFIFIVNNWDYNRNKKIFTSIAELDIKILYQREIRINNNSTTEFWDPICIFMLMK